MGEVVIRILAEIDGGESEITVVILPDALDFQTKLPAIFQDFFAYIGDIAGMDEGFIPPPKNGSGSGTGSMDHGMGDTGETSDEGSGLILGTDVRMMVIGIYKSVSQARIIGSMMVAVHLGSDVEALVGNLDADGPEIEVAPDRIIIAEILQRVAHHRETPDFFESNQG